MSRSRDLHKQVRVIYRACRRIYGIEKTQDECLKVFKVVFPELYRLRNSKEEREVLTARVFIALQSIVKNWNPKKELKRLIDMVLQAIALPFDYERTELIKLLNDIMPVAMRIRKLTPTETGRLMGLKDDEIQKMYDSGLSNSAIYKLHGNSIVVDVMTDVFRKMFIETEPDIIKGQPQQLTLF